MVDSSTQRYSKLPDPCEDRAVTETECPRLINKPLEDDVMFPAPAGKPDWRLLKEFMSREGPITKAQCTRVLQLTIALMKTESNLV